MTEHYPFLDSVRALACILVVLLHTSALQFGQFFDGWGVALCYNSLTRMAVPLFFMISGYILLDADIKSLSRFYYRRYLRILLPFSVICMLYYFTPEYRNYSIPGYLRQIATHFVDYHLWYVYAIIGLYLALPFFIKMVQGADGRKLALLYVGIWAVSFCLLPTLMAHGDVPAEVLKFQAQNPTVAFAWILQDLFSNLALNFNFLFFYGFMGYMLCAWLIRHSRLPAGPRVTFCYGLGYLAATLAIIFATWWRSMQLCAPNQLFFYHLSPFILVQTLSAFLFLAQFRAESWWIREISDKSYWIYLLHLLVLKFFVSILPLPDSYLNAILIPAYTVAIFLTSWCAAIPLRLLEKRLLKIPAIS